MTDAQRRILLFIGGVIIALLLLLIVILLTRDSGTTSAGDTSATTTTTAPVTSTAVTTTAATTSTAATTTAATTTTAAPATTAAPHACAGLSGLATPAGPHAGPQADFDGDGELDRLIGFEDGAGTWWVAIRLSTGYTSGSAVPGFVNPEGIFDFDGSLVGFARVDGGASTELVGAVFWLGCDLFEATVDSGAAARFLVGGSVTHLHGIRCSGDTLTEATAETSDGTTWEYTETDYLWVPGIGEFQVQASSIQILTSPADDAVIFGSVGYHC